MSTLKESKVLKFDEEKGICHVKVKRRSQEYTVIFHEDMTQELKGNWVWSGAKDGSGSLILFNAQTKEILHVYPNTWLPYIDRSVCLYKGSIKHLLNKAKLYKIKQRLKGG